METINRFKNHSLKYFERQKIINSKSQLNANIFYNKDVINKTVFLRKVYL